MALSAGVGLTAKRKIVVYHIKGFTCVTCAVGLDTLLRQRKGVERSKSSYPDATAEIEFNPDLVTEKSLKSFIAEMGFAVVEPGPHHGR